MVKVFNTLLASSIVLLLSACGGDGDTGPVGPGGPSGPPGSDSSGLDWIDVTETTVQSEPNTGYLADSDEQVTIVLPANPALGDIVAVSGVGTGGWKIAQNLGQQVHVGFQNVLWQGSGAAALQGGAALAGSSDGRILVVVATSGPGNPNIPIYVSTDGGESWATAHTGPQHWSSVAASSDGSRFVAAPINDPIHVSSDAGATWTPTSSPSLPWFGVASSADGLKLAAAATGDSIYVSTDGGANWTATSSGTQNWKSIASSADGQKLAAAVPDGQIYTSNDAGGTWIARDSGIESWFDIASSADGTILVAVSPQLASVAYSGDSGVTWTPYGIPIGGIGVVASSADGSSFLIGSGGADSLYTSNDSGITWQGTSFHPGVVDVAFSADGNRIMVFSETGNFFHASSKTTLGEDGSVAGTQHQAIELQYFGDGLFSTRSNEGTLRVQ